MSKEDKIREAAYFVWLNNGCPEGAEIQCWLEAEAQECTCDEQPCCCCEDEPKTEAQEIKKGKVAEKKAE